MSVNDDDIVDIYEEARGDTPPNKDGGGDSNKAPEQILYNINNDQIDSVTSTSSSPALVPTEPQDERKPDREPTVEPRETLYQPGESYPRSYDRNCLYRQRILLKTANNKELRHDLKVMSSRDILFWINTFVYTYDPRKNPSTIPFLTYDYEDKLILEIADRVKNQKDLLIDKSRDMGVTWCVLVVFLWYWQFGGDGYDFLLGSRKEQYIDVVGNMDTLMEKMRFMLKYQPSWLRPAKFNLSTHMGYMRLVNPETRATVGGEATNPNFSRGGRRRGVFFDEFAFWENDKAAWNASGDSTNCRVVVSTPCGLNNHFAKLRFSGSIDHRSLHWRLHPEKDQAWYDNECKRRNFDEVAIKQELDIDYEGSEEGILFQMADMQAATKNEPMLSAERVVVALDPSAEGDDEAPFYVSNNGNIIERKFFKKTNAMELAGEAVSLIRKHKAQVFIADAIGNDVITAVSMLLGKETDRVKIIAFKGSEKASDPVRFYNKRAEAYHYASQQMKSGNVQVDNDHTLMSQLNATKIKTKDGRLITIPKEEIKDLIGSSPDRADAWCLMVWGLKFTHSVREVQQQETYRRTFTSDVRSGQEYGDWGDQLD